MWWVGCGGYVVGGAAGEMENKAISAQPTELELDWAGLSLAIMLGLFFFKACRTFDFLGFLPIELGLKAIILNLEAEGSFLFKCS